MEGVKGGRIEGGREGRNKRRERGHKGNTYVQI